MLLKDRHDKQTTIRRPASQPGRRRDEYVTTLIMSDRAWCSRRAKDAEYRHQLSRPRSLMPLFAPGPARGSN